jgi:hypothetical protein
MREDGRFSKISILSSVFIAVVLTVGGLLAHIPGTSAQDATPVGEPVPGEECTTEPRSADFLAALIATPAATVQVTPITTLPEGTEPDEQTRAEVIAHLRQIVACTNTGEFLRALALYSDEYLRRSLNATGLLTVEAANEAISPLATPFAISPELAVRIVGYPLIRQLADGRVLALMTSIPFGGGPETTDLFILSRTDTGWTVDETAVRFEETQAAATPSS